ncbi:S-type pyocin family protein [Brevundimonas sp. FT23028]|uniref:S-type pyocin family protein n=1 Tax=Brevundimonas sp. FT23028 TaxID=3393748 RepID=UPI003B587BD7
MRKAMMIAAVGAALGIGSAGLTGCGDGGSAVETRERAAADAPAAASAPPGATAALEAPNGKSRPVLTANRRETVDAKVARLFERNGADFGARTAEDYLARVEAFTTRPPADVDRVERPNGDVLLYQASTNTFAVVSRDGVPKTMFKPRDGAAYWAEQKAAAPDFGRRQSAS